MIEFEGATPILRVDDLARSLDYYTSVLGFAVEWQDPGIIACVKRGRCRLFLAEGDQGHAGGWVWIGVSDVGPLYEAYVEKGATVWHPPTNYPWAIEMQIADPDGNVLRFASEPDEGAPVGEWRDMRGTVWKKTDEGWMRV